MTISSSYQSSSSTHQCTNSSKARSIHRYGSIDYDALDNLEFLVSTHIDSETLARANTIAAGWNVPVHTVLLSLGWISVADYVNTLASKLGVQSAFKNVQAPAGKAPMMNALQIDATQAMPSKIAQIVFDKIYQDQNIELTSSLCPEFVWTPFRKQHARAITNRLYCTAPLYSAIGKLPLWIITAIVGFIGLVVGTAIVDPPSAYFMIVCIAVIPFAMIVFLRVIALITYIRKSRPVLVQRMHTIPMADLPIYTILVPLYDEAEILPDLVDALIRLDYPAAKLDVIMILEDADQATQQAANAVKLPGFIRIVSVPDFAPRTKPKALNYALTFARGEFVNVFDAEDIPDPQQLRRALSVFAHHPEIDCLQAKLNIYNRQESWLSHQFALEYTALFDGLLPALERLKIPLPLGGTSNHFRRSALENSGAWDPYNVTEDADLGIRMQRQGYKIGMLSSTTWEEAPAKFCNWLPQRTRWIKGWMQTYIVHMRQPLNLWQDLGT